MQKCATQLAAFLTLSQEWTQQGWENKVGAEWTGLHHCCFWKQQNCALKALLLSKVLPDLRWPFARGTIYPQIR